MRLCSLCDGKHMAKGYCRKHYLRNWRYGSPWVVLVKNNKTKAGREGRKRVKARMIGKRRLQGDIKEAYGI